MASVLKGGLFFEARTSVRANTLGSTHCLQRERVSLFLFAWLLFANGLLQVVGTEIVTRAQIGGQTSSSEAEQFSRKCERGRERERERERVKESKTIEKRKAVHQHEKEPQESDFSLISSPLRLHAPSGAAEI